MIKTRIPKNPGIYTLVLKVIQSFRMKVGKLGCHNFPMGTYTYTGSAIGTKSSNLNLRVGRHLNPKKKMHWHIDYLLSQQECTIQNIIKSNIDECTLNQGTQGIVLAPGFVATDCKQGCLSHLKFRN